MFDSSALLQSTDVVVVLTLDEVVEAVLELELVVVDEVVVLHVLTATATFIGLYPSDPLDATLI